MTHLVEVLDHDSQPCGCGFVEGICVMTCEEHKGKTSNKIAADIINRFFGGKSVNHQVICPKTNKICMHLACGVQLKGESVRGPIECIYPDEIGGKEHKGKAPIWQGVVTQFPRALAQIAHITMEGAVAPGHVWNGWKEVPDGFKKYSDAMHRHATAERFRGPRDLLIHDVATTAWNALARLEHLMCEGADDADQDTD